MRHIYKKISLEQFKSRTPNVIPALDASKPNHVITFDLNELCTNPFKSKANYGMLPSDIQIPDNIARKISDVTTVNVNIPSWDNNEFDYQPIEVDYDTCYVTIKSTNEKHKYLSYHKLVEWYRFFKLHANDDEYIDLYNARGGDAMYKWLNETVFISFNIPEEYQDAWKCVSLPLPSICEWLTWFIQRDGKYRYKNMEDFVNTEDCCDYKEYIARGGWEMSKELRNFFKKIENSCNTIKSLSINSSVMNIPIILLNSIDELGEYSILSNEWYGDVDYGDYGENGRKAGTVITYDNETYYLDKPKQTSYKINNKYKEYEFDTSLKPYIKQYSNDLYNETNRYFTNKNGVKYTWETHFDEKLIGDKHQLTDGLYYLVNDEIFNAEKQDIIEYKGKVYFIKYVGGKIPYIDYKGQKIMGEYSNGDYVFHIPLPHKGKNCEQYSESISITHDVFTITIDNRTYVINENNELILNDGLINMVYKPFTSLADNILLINDDNDGYYIGEYEITQSYGRDKMLEKVIFTPIKSNLYGERKINDSEKRHYFISDGFLYIIDPYSIGDLRYISGETSSKLDVLDQLHKSYDDLGNLLGGYFNPNVVTTQRPEENEYLDIMYQIGNVSNLSYLLSENDIIYYQGNIISDIEFFFYDENGEKVSIKGEYGTNNEALNLIRNRNTINAQVYAKIIYNINAVIEYSNDQYTLSSDYHNGIEYTDEYILNEKYMPYFINDMIHYNVNYYELVSTKYNIYSITDNSESQYSSVTSTFRMERNTSVKQTDARDLTPYNGFMATPLVMEEYKIGTTSLQKVKENIYIDRGRSSAFDKHLKLLEIKSFEALEQYNNGYFNINEN